jgi:fructose-specific component phosphotransferase system IIB-like protein
MRALSVARPDQRGGSMLDETLSRRWFLKTFGAAGVTVVWPAVLAAAEQATALELLAAEDAADLAAIAAQIIPSDPQLPGASEAGVVYFMDSALRNFMAGAVDAVNTGLRALNQAAAAVLPGARFAQLPAVDQTRLLKAAEDSPFFRTVHFMTVAGMFALPAYGGNKDHVGWKLLGFNHRHAWLPPFGHYDAQFKPGAGK